MPKKWDEKADRDLLLALHVAESGTQPVSRETWEKAVPIMKALGYADATWTGISQRWSKFIYKKFQNDHPELLGDSASASAAPSTLAAPSSAATADSAVSATAPRVQSRKRQKKRPRKQEDTSEDSEEQDDEEEENKVRVKHAREAKKVKKE
ncbi:hypothetical protein F4777DRAFT_577259 [Nemania sp. FL0916]|nr:hypothetical protein F4777DRAFT_577259 [Nemania sp. FL0916]